MDNRRNYGSFAVQSAIQRRKLVARLLTFFSILCIMALAFLGMKGKHYLLISVLLLASTIVPMFLVFEYKKLRAREIVLLATWISLSVLANEICAHTFPLHIGTMMVVIAGVAMGPEAGFFIGASGRLICNFFDGQGPWTPWQMVAWGLLGFCAGLAFNKVSLRKKWEQESLAEKLSLKKSNVITFVVGPVACVVVAWLLGYIYYLLFGNGENFFGWYLYVFGIVGLVVGFLLQRKKLSADTWTLTLFTFLMVFLLYGGIMNFATLLLQHIADPQGNAITMDALKLLYITGVPYDLAHAGAAAFCMFVMGEAMLSKVTRIQTKFGIWF